MSEHLHWRRKAHLALQAYFERRSRPRVFLSIVLIATGLVGLLASMGMFHLGVERMWIRYPAAVLASYGAFLIFLRLWAQWEYAYFAPEEIASMLPPSPDQPSVATRITRSARRSAERTSDSVEGWGDVLEGLGGADGEGCFVFFLIAALVGVVVTLVLGIFAAPALLAEVFLDAFLITVIFKRLRAKADAHWLGTAIRRTWLSALGIAVFLSIAGACLAHLAPGARSLGQAVREYAEERSSRR
jgi:hypothetical protein